MNTTTSSEIVKWNRFFELELNTQTKSDRYSARIAHEVFQLRKAVVEMFGGKYPKIEEKDFLLEFVVDDLAEIKEEQIEIPKSKSKVKKVKINKLSEDSIKKKITRSISAWCGFLGVKPKTN